MKIVYKIFFIFVSFILLCNSVFAENFYIENYNVKIDVQVNKDIKIKETIDTYFTIPSHGIFRTIPLKYTIQREDGSTQKINARIRDLKASDYHSKSYIIGDNKSIKIKMGDADKYIEGRKTYYIDYDYIIPADNINDSDEFYFNIIGTEWKTNINNVSFQINMPKPFNTELIGFSIGTRGSTGYSPEEIFYSVEGNTISGYLKRPLEEHEGLTIRIILPENYFQISNNSQERNLTIFGILFLVLISFVIWLIYGKDEKAIPVVNFYPPKRENSAQVGINYRGKADTREIVSLIIYLANAGYMEIEEEGKSFTITKKKSYDGTNKAERMLYNALFTHGDIVKKEELETSHTFYKSCQKIIKHLNNTYRINIFDKNAVTPAKVIIMTGCILGIICLLVYSLNDYQYIFDLSILPFSYMLIFIIIPIYILITTYTKTGATITEKVFTTIWALMFGWFPMLSLFELSAKSFSNTDTTVIITGVVSLITSLVCLINLPKRNKKGLKELGNVLGLKQFLTVAEKHRIEMLVAENPNYCYDILPYAYVLDVSDKWISNFEAVMKEPPNWYKGNTYSGRYFGPSFCEFTNSFARISVPSTANGGISRSSRGLGGSAGGGCGGGGGGSW